jgi:hypothetical protein
METIRRSPGFGRRLLNGLWNCGLALATVAGLWGGLTAAYLACQFHMVSGAATPEAQTLSVAELLKKGPGKNVHLHLTELAFGKPVILEHPQQQGKTIWVPVLPEPRPAKPTERAVYFRARAADEAQLEELLRRTELDVVVLSSLPELSWWRPMPLETDGLKKTDERVLAAKAYLLRDPALRLGPLGDLSPSVAFAGNTVTVAWLVGGGAISVGIFLLLLLCTARGPSNQAAPEALGNGTEYEYGRLVNEIPQSEHVMPSDVLRGRLIRRGVLAACLLLPSVLFIAAVPVALDGPLPSGAVGFFVISLFFFLLTVWVVQRARGLSKRVLTAVSVCHSGLRLWQGDQPRLALWADIAGVNTKEVEVQVRGQGGSRGGTTWLKLRNGERFTIRSGDLSDWVVFARHLHENVNGHNGQVVSQHRRRGLGQGGFLPRREYADE